MRFPRATGLKAYRESARAATSRRSGYRSGRGCGSWSGENRELKMENEFLKKAAAYFASGASVSEKYEFIDAEYAAVAAESATRSDRSRKCALAGGIPLRVLRMEIAAGIRDREKEGSELRLLDREALFEDSRRRPTGTGGWHAAWPRWGSAVPGWSWSGR